MQASYKHGKQSAELNPADWFFIMWRLIWWDVHYTMHDSAHTCRHFCILRQCESHDKYGGHQGGPERRHPLDCRTTKQDSVISALPNK